MSVVTGKRARRAGMLGALLLGATASAGTLGTLQPTDDITLLGGRLVVRGPVPAKHEARQRTGPAADPSDEVESRLVMDADDERMVVIVEELFALAGDDLAAGVRRREELAPGTPVVPLALQDAKLHAVEVVPAGPPEKEDVVPVLNVFVAQDDHTVQAMRFFANREAARDLDGCRELARRMAKTLRPGTRHLATGGGERIFGPVALTLPAGYLVASESGADFVVTHVQKLLPLTAPAQEVGLYVGNHPRMHHERPDAGQVMTTPSELLDAKVTWYHWAVTDPDGTRTEQREAIAPLADGRQLHVWLMAPDAGAMAELLAMLGSLRSAH